MPEELQNFLDDDKDKNLSVLDLNIRNINNKNAENLKVFIESKL